MEMGLVINTDSDWIWKKQAGAEYGSRVASSEKT